MAPLTRRQKKALLAAAPPPPPPVIDSADPVINPADRISSLHPDIQAHILSFLPAQEAVQTCVHGPTWRHVWKSSRRLVITGSGTWEKVSRFVDGLFRERGDAPLDAVEFRFDGTVDGDDYYIFDSEESSSLNRWIRHCVLKYQIQMLLVDISNFHGHLVMSIRGRETLVSSHLTRLELTGVWFISDLNMDGCPQLEHLEINECIFQEGSRIMSLSLKSLAITSCQTDGDFMSILHICLPCLNSLLLDFMYFKTPLLERMPELMRATVHIDCPHYDSCDCGDPMTCNHVMQPDDTADEEGSQGYAYAGQNTTKCMVLEGLAQAKDIVLIAHPSTYTLRRDLRWCPTFSKLKTLVINGDYWCQPADCNALECILEHAPLLEKLTLVSYQWLGSSRKSRGTYKVEMKGHPDATVKSTKISQHLKVVEIKCEDVVNETFVSVLNFLGTLNIGFDINVTKK